MALGVGLFITAGGCARLIECRPVEIGRIAHHSMHVCTTSDYVCAQYTYCTYTTVLHTYTYVHQELHKYKFFVVKPFEIVLTICLEEVRRGRLLQVPSDVTDSAEPNTNTSERTYYI